VLLALLVAWPAGLALWVDAKLGRVEALAPGGAQGGRTYLVAGSDRRGSGGVEDTIAGARADSILLVHVAANGQAYLVSIPRDTYVELEGYGGQKINAAYAFGGPELLVSAVQQLSGMHIDRYVEVGFGSVTELVDAVGGVELCLDLSVQDRNSKLDWEAGCHQADGALALAFSRMRYSDPLGDIGRVARQRQVVAAVVEKAVEPSLLWRPDRQVALARAGAAALTVDREAGVLDLARLVLDFRAATGPDGIQGVPAIKDTAYQPGGIGQAVLLDPDQAPADFAAIQAGTWAGRAG
jgi:LCP family protein required for cell wall assembly